MKASSKLFAALALALMLPSVYAEASEKEPLPAGTILAVRIDSDAKMKVGIPVRGHLTEPVYSHDRLLIPAGAVVDGKIIALHPASHHRSLNAKLQGDFTPLHDAAVQFQDVRLPAGTEIALSTDPTTEGVETLRIQSAYAAAHHQSIARRVWNDLNGRKNDAVATFTAPGKASRLKKMFYNQLPYHPETLDSGLEYNAELNQPLELSVVGIAPKEAAQNDKKGLEKTATLHALLTTPVDSKTAIQGTPVKAEVTEPFFDDQNRVIVPQGSLLIGKVSQSKPAGRWGRNGILRFTFNQLQFPAGFKQEVYGTTSAIAVDHRSNMQMDVEGGVSAQKPSALLPLAMGVLSAAALQEDEASLAHAATSSNGFALIGRALALGTQSNYVGGAIGAYGTARTAYSRFIAHGADVFFPKDTRIEIEVDPITSRMLETH
ncbi:MAG TPA: hypothetical protein VKW78_22940 [Terriglobales bacterium]|nr:hypothetical protein [Terriglobales bacterium]